VLSEAGGKMPSKRLEKLAAEAGHPERTLK
jgi:hypothetical protein